MRTIGRIAYGIAALSLLAVILVSLDYTLVQSILISLIFCPCALLLEVLMPHASKPSDKVYLSLAVLVAVVLLILVLHNFMWSSLTWDGYFGVPVAPMLVNPVFLALVLTALSIGDFFWARFMAAAPGETSAISMLPPGARQISRSRSDFDPTGCRRR